MDENDLATARQLLTRADSQPITPQVRSSDLARLYLAWADLYSRDYADAVERGDLRAAAQALRFMLHYAGLAGIFFVGHPGAQRVVSKGRERFWARVEKITPTLSRDYIASLDSAGTIPQIGAEARRGVIASTHRAIGFLEQRDMPREAVFSRWLLSDFYAALLRQEGLSLSDRTALTSSALLVFEQEMLAWGRIYIELGENNDPDLKVQAHLGLFRAYSRWGVAKTAWEGASNGKGNLLAKRETSALREAWTRLLGKASPEEASQVFEIVRGAMVTVAQFRSGAVAAPRQEAAIPALPEYIGKEQLFALLKTLTAPDRTEPYAEEERYLRDIDGDLVSTAQLSRDAFAPGTGARRDAAQRLFLATCRLNNVPLPGKLGAQLSPSTHSFSDALTRALEMAGRPNYRDLRHPGRPDQERSRDGRRDPKSSEWLNPEFLKTLGRARR